MMKKSISSLILVSISIFIFSQEFEVPKDYVLVKAEDYAPYEDDIIQCVDWLMKTPLDRHIVKRKDANAFLLAWLTGSPNVIIEISEKIVTFMGSTPDLLMIFMGGWAKYSLETRDFNNKIAGNLAGIESVIDLYKKNKNILGKNKEVEKYIKMQQKGTLEDYIKTNTPE